MGGNEDSPLATLADMTTEDVTDETYGGLKVECETVAREAYGDSCSSCAPPTSSAPYDYTHRFTYWVERIAAGGTVLAPGPRDYGIQLIDAPRPGGLDHRMLESRHSGHIPHAVAHRHRLVSRTCWTRSLMLSAPQVPRWSGLIRLPD